jgi:hypothetical protein
MRAVHETRDNPAIQAECHRPRFLFELMGRWHAVKKLKTKQGPFFDQQEDMMKRFDQDHPDDHPPAGMPLPSAERPKFPVKPVPVMLAEGSKERTAAIRQLSPPPKATFFVPQKPAVTPPKSRPLSPPKSRQLTPPQSRQPYAIRRQPAQFAKLAHRRLFRCRWPNQTKMQRVMMNRHRTKNRHPRHRHHRHRR